MNEGLLARTWSDVRSHWRHAVLFHLLMQLVGIAVFAPAVTWIGRSILQASGEPVISNFDIASFVLSPSGVAFVLVVAILVVGLLLAELAGLSWIAAHAITARTVTVTATIAFVLRALPLLAGLSARILLRLVAFAVPFAAAAALVWYTTLAEYDINYYLAEQPPEWRRATVIGLMLGAGFTLLAAWQLARWLFAVPILVLERAEPRQALAISARMTRGKLVQTTPLLLWWLLLTAAAVALTWLCREISAAGLDWAGVDARRVLPLVAVYSAVALLGGFVYGALHLVGHQFFTTRLYGEQADPARWSMLAVAEARDARSARGARPAVAGLLTLFAVALGTVGLAAARLDLETNVAVTAHRGASIASPENTLAAFKAALDAAATYIELDVQRTRDGEIVVLHDGDFMRLADDSRKLGELTLEDIATIDIGRKFGAAYAGERAPRLGDVIDLVRGRAKINVELKYNVPDSELAPAVVELLRSERFLDQVVITSLDYAALRDIEKIEPSLITGHIVTAAVGDVVRTEADFLSINSARATASLIRRAHAAGKDVHVWTVNTPEVMVRMIERGVDNIITDDPALLGRVLAARKTLSKPELLGLRLRVLFAKPPRELTDPAAVTPL